MKPYERRATGQVTYYKLATWDAVSHTWRDGRRTYHSPERARLAALKEGRGRYRISRVIVGQPRVDLEPFEIISE